MKVKRATNENHFTKEKINFSGNSDWSPLWLLPFIGMTASFVIAKSGYQWNVKLLLIIITVTITSTFLIAFKTYYRYRIFATKIVITYPVSKRNIVILFSQIININYRMPEDDDSSGYSLDGIWIYYNSRGKVQKQKIPIHGINTKKIIAILSYFKRNGLSVIVHPRQKKVNSSLQSIFTD